MNAELQKDTGARKRAMKRYMSRHQTMCVTLSMKDDADIIAWLNKQKNRSAAIRAVLKVEANKHEQSYIFQQE